MFIQPYFVYAIEVWGHTIQSADILSRVQSKILRIIFDYKRSDDAWSYNDGRILHIEDLYKAVIQKICFKHHMDIMPKYFTNNTMPDFNISQLGSRITRISLDKMYDYKIIKPSSSVTSFKKNCQKLWNSLPMDTKILPYANKNIAIHLFDRKQKNK